jgi:predicted ArsR family transcriptional regulator
MSKEELLSYLHESQGAAAHGVAREMDVLYPTAAMALLRLVRQGLVERFVEPTLGTFWYRLTDRGAERLAYLRSGE